MQIELEFHILPKRRGTWFLWLALVIVALPVYYTIHPYPGLASRYEETRWVECPSGPFCEMTVAEDGIALTATARIPRYVTDFVEMPLEVRLANSGDVVEPVVVTVRVTGDTSSHARIYIRPAGASPVAIPYDSVLPITELEQSSMIINSIPMSSTATATFLVRVSGGGDSEAYSVKVLVNGRQTNPRYLLATEFNRVEVFKLWVTQHLLFPPGSFYLVPFGMLLLVSFGEWTALAAARLKHQWRPMSKHVREVIGALIPPAVAATILGFGLPLLPDFIPWVMVAFLGSGILGALYGYFDLIIVPEEEAPEKKST